MRKSQEVAVRLRPEGERLALCDDRGKARSDGEDLLSAKARSRRELMGCKGTGT